MKQTDQEKGNDLLGVITDYIILRNPYEAEKFYNGAMHFYKKANVNPPYEADRIKERIDEVKDWWKEIEREYEVSKDLGASL